MINTDQNTQLDVHPSKFYATVEGLDDRCLPKAAKWLLELAEQLPKSAAWPPKDALIAEVTTREHSCDSRYRLAKSYFNSQEYSRCLERLESDGTTNGKYEFLRLYAHFMQGEKLKVEESETVLGPEDGKQENSALVKLAVDLEQFRESGKSDTYLLYLLGVVYRRLRNEEAGIVVLMEAVHLCEYNWAAWEELSACMTTSAKVNKTLSMLPRGLCARIFHIKTLLDLHTSGQEVTDSLDLLEQYMGTTLCTRTFRALLAYNAQDFDTAEALFATIEEENPSRIDHLDIYSNVLYVLENRHKLGNLAHSTRRIDQFRPETCCIAGNYWSLMGEHEKAVEYFRKALKLNRSYIAAWTLLGHEYMELKNPHAAIDSYRRAVNFNRVDYRAWYGLGMTYEMLEMHYYALHYFQRAAALKPYDTRMWTAMGNCFEKLGRLAEAIKAYRRALSDDSSLDFAHFLKIGELYEQAGNLNEARKYYLAAVSAAAQDPMLDASSAQAWLDNLEQS